MDNLIAITPESLIDNSKQDIDIIVADIINGIPEKRELDYYLTAYKFEYLAKQLKDSILKSKAKERFIEQFHGSSLETANGFKMQLVTTKEYEFSEKVKAIEKKIKSLQIDLKAQKEKEKSDAKEIGSNTILKCQML